MLFSHMWYQSAAPKPGSLGAGWEPREASAGQWQHKGSRDCKLGPIQPLRYFAIWLQIR